MLSGVAIWADVGSFYFLQFSLQVEIIKDDGVKRAMPKGDDDFDVMPIYSLPIAAQLYFVENKSTCTCFIHFTCK